MAKNQYIGVNNVARHVSQPYIGIGNVARKVKSGYIGVGGVARQYYESVVYNTWKKYSFTSADFYYMRDFATISGSMNNYSTWYWRFPFYKGTTPPTNALCITGNYTTISIANPSLPAQTIGYTFNIPYSSLKSMTISSVATLTARYYRVSSKSYCSDQYVNFSGYTWTGNYIRVIIPGWKYSGDSLYDVDSYGRTWIYPIWTPDLNYTILILYEDDDDYGTSCDVFQCTNNVSTIIAPQGTYPDNGLHTDGCVYIKQ